MKLLLLLAAPVCLAAPRVDPPAAPTPTAATDPARPAADTYEDLVASYELELAVHEEALLAARDLKARRKLEKDHPVHDHWRQFRRLAKQDGRALVWLAAHADVAEDDPKKARKLVEGYYEDLFDDHVGSPWFGDVLSLLKDDDDLPEPERLALYEATLEGNEHAEVQCEALYRMAWSRRRIGGEGAEEAALELLRRSAERAPGTRYATSARAEVITDEEVAEGAQAPDFYAEDLDGHAFKLSDYRGKVVLLDFYGFW